jgi:hypothetical protein
MYKRVQFVVADTVPWIFLRILRLYTILSWDVVPSYVTECQVTQMKGHRPDLSVNECHNRNCEIDFNLSLCEQNESNMYGK